MTRRPPPILLAVVLAPLSLALGYIGYREADPGLEVTDALYASLQLFTVGGMITEQTPWQLELARLLAPLAVVYAAVVTGLAVMRDRAQQAAVRLVARNHVLVVGLDATTALVARGLRQRGHRVVALELDPRNPRTAAARSDRVRVVIGDGTSPEHLRRAQVGRARDILVLTSDDGRNLEVAAAVRHTMGSRRATVHVAVSDLALWKELDRVRLGADGGDLTTEYVSLDDRTAQRLLAAAADITGHDAPPWIGVDGDTGVAVRVVAHLVRRALLNGVRPRVDLVGHSSQALLDRVRLEEPWCAQHADLIPATDAAAPLIIVCRVDSDSAAMARALMLVRQLPAAAVVVAVYRPRSEEALRVAGSAAARVHLVPAALDAVGAELLERSSIELMARVRHEDYVVRERSKPSADANPSLVGWDVLPESLRESNRAFARAVNATLAQLGATLTPLAGPVDDRPLPVPAPLLDELARGEHARWMESLIGDGWERTDGPKDPVAKRHPLLVPWEELDEAEREKDRDAFRALPHMLARIGYALQLDGDGQRNTA